MGREVWWRLWERGEEDGGGAFFGHSGGLKLHRGAPGLHDYGSDSGMPGDSGECQGFGAVLTRGEL